MGGEAPPPFGKASGSGTLQGPPDPQNDRFPIFRKMKITSPKYSHGGGEPMLARATCLTRKAATGHSATILQQPLVSQR